MSAGEVFQTFEAALHSLAAPDEPLSASLVRALSGASGADLATWSRQWPDIATERRQRIAHLLLTTTEADFQVNFKPLFINLLDDPDPEVRAMAIDGLWEAHDLFLMDRFVEFLASDLDPEVRAHAAAALGTFLELGELDKIDIRRTRRALLVVLDAANDEGEDLEVRRRATESAGYADSPQVRALIEDAINSPERAMRAAAVRAMGNSADDRWAEEVLAGLEDPDPELRFEASHAAGELAIGAAVPLLADLAAGGDREIQLEAIWALGEIGGEPARRVLERLAGTLDYDDDVAEAFEDALATVMLSEGIADWDDLSVPPTGRDGRSSNGQGRDPQGSGEAGDEEGEENEWDEDDEGPDGDDWDDEGDEEDEEDR